MGRMNNLVLGHVSLETKVPGPSGLNIFFVSEREGMNAWWIEVIKAVRKKEEELHTAAQN